MNLSRKKYLRAIPEDPITEKKDWRIIYEEFDEFEDPEFQPGIWNVRSRARGQATDGSLYRKFGSLA
jgi:hypothetical protein